MFALSIFNFDLLFYFQSLSKYWLGNPALPRLLKVTPTVYPHMNDFTRKLNFCYKDDPLKLESQNHAKNVPVGLPSSLIKIQGFLSYDRTNKQTNRDYNFI